MLGIPPKAFQIAWVLIAYLFFAFAGVLARQTVPAAVEVLGLLRTGGVVSYGCQWFCVLGSRGFWGNGRALCDSHLRCRAAPAGG